MRSSHAIAVERFHLNLPASDLGLLVSIVMTVFALRTAFVRDVNVAFQNESELVVAVPLVWAVGTAGTETCPTRLDRASYFEQPPAANRMTP